MPAWKTIAIRMQQIRDRHMPGGKDLHPGHRKDVFENVSEAQLASPRNLSPEVLQLFLEVAQAHTFLMYHPDIAAIFDTLHYHDVVTVRN